MKFSPEATNSVPPPGSAPRNRPTLLVLALCGAAIVAVLGVRFWGPHVARGAAAGPPPLLTPSPLSFPPTGDPVLVGAGDIADCTHLADAQATADLIDSIPGEVFTVGDNAYPSGTAEQFRDCYDPTWGRARLRTRPAPGNHEFHSAQATPYFDYFGANAGDPHAGYYSYNLRGWHIVVLNSECQQVGGCQEGSAQEQWLRQDLAAHAAACTAAYWHKPFFSSGKTHGNDPEVRAFWDDLYAAHATLVINGHDHDYERFAPQNPAGERDDVHGIREFVVGTGGKSQRVFGDPLPTTEVRNTGAYGVLKLTLHPKSYDWEFIPVPGKTFRDSGEDSCRSGVAQP